MSKFIKGYLRRTVYRSDSNDFSILRVDIKDTDLAKEEVRMLKQTDSFYITVSGHFPPLSVDNLYIFKGEITKHSKYGHQFSATTFENEVDKSFVGVVTYLSSDLFEGVGPKTASKVVIKLGVDAIDKIEKDKNILDTVIGLSERAKNTIYEGIIKNKDTKTIFTKLYEFGLSSIIATRIYEKYRNESINILKNNPYILIDDIEYIGFKKADEIALKIGFDLNSPERIVAAIKYLIKKASEDLGFTYLTKDQLFTNVSDFINTDEYFLDLKEFETYLNELIINQEIINEDDLYFSYDLYIAETEISNNLKQIKNLDNIDIIAEDTIEKIIDDLEKDLGITYSEKQYDAIKDFQNEKIMILTGGPGTGKTTVIKGIIETFLKLNKISISNPKNQSDILALAAPTGRAAKKMAEATNYYASTIHRLLGYSIDGEFTFDENNKLIRKLIIIDESSMIDVYLAAHLFKTIDIDTRILIVGDHNQLPSVGPGQVLLDLIESQMFKTIELTEIHRQAENSNIVKLAHKVKNGIYDNDFYERYEDTIFIKTNEIPSNITRVIDSAIEKGYDLFEDIQVLIPMYRGDNGINNINKVIQSKYNKLEAFDKEIINGERSFRLNDKVMQLKNHAELGIMNGDIGIVIGLSDEEGKDLVIVDFDSIIVKYEPKDLINLIHAYAVSIHKSQGSEYKIVIIPLVRSYYKMLKRKLLYTAITRAKESLILIGDPYALNISVSNLEKERQTKLKDRLNNLIISNIIDYEDSQFDEITPFDFMEDNNE